jgi:hypothetical protein
VGIDTGLVHTGCVRMMFLPDSRTVMVGSLVVAGPDAVMVAEWVRRLPSPMVFVEAYRPRHTYDTNPDMVKGVAEMKRLTGGLLLVNTGVKKVVRQDVMELLEVWRFPTPTHHQDLRSAARIALFGMLKIPDLNRLLADVVRDHLDGRTWQVLL